MHEQVDEDTKSVCTFDSPEALCFLLQAQCHPGAVTSALRRSRVFWFLELTGQEFNIRVHRSLELCYHGVPI
jgi:hypothetical protein